MTVVDHPSPCVWALGYQGDPSPNRDRITTSKQPDTAQRCWAPRRRAHQTPATASSARTSSRCLLLRRRYTHKRKQQQQHEIPPPTKSGILIAGFAATQAPAPAVMGHTAPAAPPPHPTAPMQRPPSIPCPVRMQFT